MTTPQDSTNTTERGPQSSGSLRTNRGVRRAPTGRATCRPEGPGSGSRSYCSRTSSLSGSSSPDQAPVEVPYTFFKEEVRAGNVEAIYSQGDTVEGRFEEPVTYPPKEGGSQPGSPPSSTSKTFTTVLPSFVDPGLEELLIENGVEISAEPIQEGGGLWQTLLFAFGPALLLIGGYIWLYRRAQQQAAA